MTHQGIVVTYFEKKQWGFIEGKDGSIFFHRSNCEYQPQLGDNITYEIGAPFRLGKSPQAVNVRLAGVKSVVLNRCRYALSDGFRCTLPEDHDGAHEANNVKFCSGDADIINDGGTKS